MRSSRVRRKRSTTRLRAAALVGCGLVLAVAGFSWAIETINLPPRSMANHVERRASGHGSVVLAIGNRLAELLLWLDRDSIQAHAWPGLRLGAQTDPAPPTRPDNTRVHLVLVATVAEATQAFEQAKPGDAITFAPGTYRFAGSGISANRAGTKAAVITVRADQPGTVTLEFNMTEGFVVSEPYWTFENLSIRGACAH